MFDNLKEAWITEIYDSYKAILLPDVNNQLSTTGLLLDLNSLPINPVPFKELFIKWLILINRDRLAKGQSILINEIIVKSCPLWKLIRCPLKKITLTKVGMFNKPKASVSSIGSKKSLGSFNK